MAKRITFSNTARGKIKKGIDTLANAVKVTLGPKGKAVVFRQGQPIFCLDGVTIANQIELEDKIESIGCDLVKDVARRTDREAGDGTTTATILAQVIFREGLKAKAAGIDMIGVNDGIRKGLEIALGVIEKTSKPVKNKRDMLNVATIASRDPKVGEIVADIVDKVGKDAIITVEESNVIGLHKEIVEGMQFDRGFISPYFITHGENMEAVLEKPYVLVTDQNVSSNQDVFRLLEDIATTDEKSLVIIAEDVNGEALQTLIMNKVRGVLRLAAAKAPGTGDNKKENLMDIAAITGAEFISEDVGRKIDDVEIKHLGRADRIILTRENTVIVGGKGKKATIQGRISALKKTIEKEQSDYYKSLLEARMAKLKGGVAVLKVGTISPQENKEKRYRIEDAVRSTKSAIEEGIVSGAGMMLVKCAMAIRKATGKEQRMPVRMGMQILEEAIQEPAKQIVENAGGKGEVVLGRCLDNLSSNPNFGYNSATRLYCDLVKEGVIDPAKVVRCALENAVSVVSLFLVTEAVITEIPQDDAKKDSKNTN